MRGNAHFVIIRKLSNCQPRYLYTCVYWIENIHTFLYELRKSSFQIRYVFLYFIQINRIFLFCEYQQCNDASQNDVH